MKDTIKILLIALPFSLITTYCITFIKQLGFGSWLVESLSIRGFWPVSIAFYIEDFLSALITIIPYVGLVYFLVKNKRFLTIFTSIMAYIIFTFLFLFLYQNESVTGTFYTLIQSSYMSVYLAIISMFLLIEKVFIPKKST